MTALAIEAFSIIGWWTAFQSTSSILGYKSPLNAPDAGAPNIIALLGGGAISGLVVAGVCLPQKNIRLFPESLAERRMIPSTMFQSTAVKLAASHALFWTTYTGLRNAIHLARTKKGRISEDNDLEDSFNDFLSGSVAGLIYRAGSLAYSRGPLASTISPQLIGGTALRFGIVCATFQFADFHLKRQFL
jgi:hypothetical protein